MDLLGPHRIRWLAGTALALLLGWALYGALDGGDSGSDAAPTSASAQGPNFVIVLTDDEVPSWMERMPWLWDHRERWLRFERAYTNQAWCCPARASLLSGQYSHTHGVVSNDLGQVFEDDETLATALDRAGYETGLFGKYMNGFPWENGQDYVPPGWDEWTSFFHMNGGYDEFKLSVGGEVREYERSEGAYSTDLFAEMTRSFLRSAEPPFFAYYAPYAPHGPATPAERHRGAFGDEPVPHDPSFNRVAPDQPRFYRSLRPAPADNLDATIRRRWAALLSVDEAVRSFMRVLREEGLASSTYVLFLADHGTALGSHRHRHKNCLYEACARIPLWVRLPGGETGTVTTPVSIADLASTLTQLAGTEMHREQDGASVASFIEGTRPWPQDRDVLLEVHRDDHGVPSGYGVASDRWKYMAHETGERELYDLRTDPYELDNLAGTPGFGEVEAELAARLEELRDDGAR